MIGIPQRTFRNSRKDDVLVILSDVPIAGTALTDPFERGKMEKEGKLLSVEAVIDAKGQAVKISTGSPPLRPRRTGGRPSA